MRPSPWIEFSVLLFAFEITTLPACGNVDPPSNPVIASTSGAFSNASLSGAYVFSFSGNDRSRGNESVFAAVGSLTADGNGGFTTGTIDIADPALGAALNTTFVFSRLETSGTYNITADGRGSGTIAVTINGTQVQFGLDFVLTSGSHGLISRFDGNGSGSGTIDLQALNVAQSALQGSYAFGLSGVDVTTANSVLTAGAFTLDVDGNITAGVEDFSNNGKSTNLQALAIQGSVIAGSPESAQLTTSAAGFGTLHFDVWVVDPTHLKFIETDANAYLEGDAFVSTGQTALPSGPLVFLLSGQDTALGSYSAGGLLSSDGSSLITGGLEDVNDLGLVAQAPSVTGSFSSSGARTVLTLNGIYNGNLAHNSLVMGNYTFAVYPYSGGAMLMEIDNGAGTTLGIAAGNLYVQSATTVASSQNYGFNLTGTNSNGETDVVAEFTTSVNGMSGLYDANNFGLLITGASLGASASYSVDASGRGTAEFPYLQINGNSFITTLDLAFYVIDSATVAFIETDTSQSATGMFSLQNAIAATTPARSHFSVQRSTTTSHAAGYLLKFKRTSK